MSNGVVSNQAIDCADREKLELVTGLDDRKIKVNH